jgi:hypothetical protein
MTTEELIAMPSPRFVEQITALDARTCERHARDIVHRLGGPATFEVYMMEVTRAALGFQGPQEDRIAELYRVGERLFPHVPPGYDILVRLTTLVLKMMAERAATHLFKSPSTGRGWVRGSGPDRSPELGDRCRLSDGRCWDRKRSARP